MSNIVIQVVNDGTAEVNMRIAYFRRIVKIGNSNAIIIPRDVRIMIGAQEGDWVRIEVSKFEPNLHVDDAARQDPETRDQGIHQDARCAQVDYSKGNGGTRL